jgi:hypothetical protein
MAGSARAIRCVFSIHAGSTNRTRNYDTFEAAKIK